MRNTPHLSRGTAVQPTPYLSRDLTASQPCTTHYLIRRPAPISAVGAASISAVTTPYLSCARRLRCRLSTVFQHCSSSPALKPSGLSCSQGCEHRTAASGAAARRGLVSAVAAAEEKVKSKSASGSLPEDKAVRGPLA
jgi:hypothetical protein